MPTSQSKLGLTKDDGSHPLPKAQITRAVAQRAWRGLAAPTGDSKSLMRCSGWISNGQWLALEDRCNLPRWYRAEACLTCTPQSLARIRGSVSTLLYPLVEAEAVPLTECPIDQPFRVLWYVVDGARHPVALAERYWKAFGRLGLCLSLGSTTDKDGKVKPWPLLATTEGDVIVAPLDVTQEWIEGCRVRVLSDLAGLAE